MYLRCAAWNKKCGVRVRPYTNEHVCKHLERNRTLKHLNSRSPDREIWIPSLGLLVPKSLSSTLLEWPAHATLWSSLVAPSLGILDNDPQALPCEASSTKPAKLILILSGSISCSLAATALLDQARQTSLINPSTLSAGKKRH